MKQDKESKINRRRFCLLGATAMASLGIPEVITASSTTPGALRGGCVATVVRRCSFADLQSCWADDPDSGPCEAFADGQELHITPEIFAAYDRGEIICRHAWRALRPYVVAMMGGKSMTAVCSPLRAESNEKFLVSCPEGSRPVLFALKHMALT